MQLSTAHYHYSSLSTYSSMRAGKAGVTQTGRPAVGVVGSAGGGGGGVAAAPPPRVGRAPPVAAAAGGGAIVVARRKVKVVRTAAQARTAQP